MFRRRARVRTLNHNKKIASLLSFVAGMVGAIGVVSINRLVINATGNVIFFTRDIFEVNLLESLIFLLYVLFFFFGSFVSNLLIELTTRYSQRLIYVIPAFIESLILIFVAIFGEKMCLYHINTVAFILLFAMGLQNSLVTIISNAIVRTTHLSGLITDLGIEISQLFFYKSESEKKSLKSTIGLRLRIVIFFVIGGVAGAAAFNFVFFYALFIPAFLLLTGIFYDYIKFKVLLLGRRYEVI